MVRGGWRWFTKPQSSLDRYVALKVLPPTFAAKDPNFVKRFEREARSIARLHHPNILSVYDFGIDGDYSFIVMRYVEGSQTLVELMREQPLSHEQAIDLISQIAKALTYAHKHGIIHRDIKPSNVLIDDGWVLLSDFGLAKVSEASIELTGSRMGIGTPAYMSPEQGQGGKIDQRTDIYALGVILYQMLTGTIPHKADTPWAILMKRTNEPPSPPRELNPDISKSIEQVLLRALATEPKHRYSSAEDFEKALQKASVDESYRETLIDLVDEPTTIASSNEPLTPPPVQEASTQITKKQGLDMSPNLIWAIIAIVALAGVFVCVGIVIGDEFSNSQSTTSAASPTSEIQAVTHLLTSTHTPTAVIVHPSLVETEFPGQLRPQTEFGNEGVSTHTPTARSTQTPTNTPVPATPTTRATNIPPLPTQTPTATSLPPTHTPISTLIPTNTSAPPTATPTHTPLPPTSTQTPLISTAPPTGTPTLIPTPTASMPSGTFALLNPLNPDEPSFGLTEFEWQWVGTVPPDFGFEVSVWREDETQAGAHDAVLDNTEGKIVPLGENKYRLIIDITEVAGVKRRSGEYLWTVALVQINPNYANLGQQATPTIFRFELAGGPDGGGGGGGGDGGGGSGGGSGNVGVD